MYDRNVQQECVSVQQKSTVIQLEYAKQDGGAQKHNGNVQQMCNKSRVSTVEICKEEQDRKPIKPLDRNNTVFMDYNEVLLKHKPACFLTLRWTG